MITKEMYELAKQIVTAYERVDPDEALRVKMRTTFDNDNYNNPFEVGEIMPCCGQRHCHSYATMKYMSRNPRLKYRENLHNEGDVDYDSKSPSPFHVDYNNTREAIRQAKAKGLRHVHFSMSVSTANAIVKEGYIDHNDKLNTISW